MVCTVKSRPPPLSWRGVKNGVPRRGYKAPSYRVIRKGLKELIRGPLFCRKGGILCKGPQFKEGESKGPRVWERCGTEGTLKRFG